MDQIRTGTLQAGDALPIARRMADNYGVASMTAQRALRELQHLGLTYAVVGKGTFVHPLARERAGTDGKPVPDRGGTPAMAEDPNLNRRVAEFLLRQNEIVGRIVDAMLAKDLHAINAAIQELANLKAAHQGLDDDIAKYEANAGIEPTITEPSAMLFRPYWAETDCSLTPSRHQPGTDAGSNPRIAPDRRPPARQVRKLYWGRRRPRRNSSSWSMSFFGHCELLQGIPQSLLVVMTHASAEPQARRGHLRPAATSWSNDHIRHSAARLPHCRASTSSARRMPQRHA
ncbi:GntR family transcriptional regulator [Actinoplanes sp. GCM10030250]|uniref:GntR family transcriptional regulator n=1 Tax=Actinoplanes sp. GCM10030250 TaxID=3273376 RepID=UPI00361B963A